MENIFIFIIAIGASIFITLPFFRKRLSEEKSQGANSSDPIEEKLRNLNSEKESLYSALKEIDFDFSTGKLSKEDYDELEKRYKAEAVFILKEIDNIKGKTNAPNLDEEIEKEIRAIQEAKLTDEEEIEKEILKGRESEKFN